MTFIPFAQLETIAIDFTSHCNSMCGNCSRNHGGTIVNSNMPLSHMDLELWKHIMTKQNLAQVTEIMFNGAYGDAPMNPNLISALEYLLEITDTPPMIRIDTNGGMNTPLWWKELAEVLSKFPKPTHVTFSIDGLEDTNHLYRRGVIWEKVIENAKAFIDAGGWARWRSLIFTHNKHQIFEMKKLSEDIGFQKFDINGGHPGAAIDAAIGKAKESFNANKKQSAYEVEYAFLKHEENIKNRIKEYGSLQTALDKSPISCKWQNKRMIQISHVGEVWPCCFFLSDRYPKSPDSIFYKDIKNVLGSNEEYFNHLSYHTLEEILNHVWFKEILTDSWNTDRFAVCSRNCGQ